MSEQWKADLDRYLTTEPYDPYAEDDDDDWQDKEADVDDFYNRAGDLDWTRSESENPENPEGKKAYREHVIHSLRQDVMDFLTFSTPQQLLRVIADVL